MTGKDIIRLSKGLGLTAEEILRALDFYILGESESLPKGLQEVSRIKTEKGLAIIALRKVNEGDCVFLEDNLCMIHPIRPAVCRSFPFTFRDDGGILTRGFSSMREICPGLGEGDFVDIDDLNALGLEILKELSYYEKFVKKWNEDKESTTALTFIEDVLFSATKS